MPLKWDLRCLLAPVSLTTLFAQLVVTTPGHTEGHFSWKLVCCPLLVLHKPWKDGEASLHTDGSSKEAGERMGSHCKHIGCHPSTCHFMKCARLHKEDNKPRLGVSVVTISQTDLSGCSQSLHAGLGAGAGMVELMQKLQTWKNVQVLQVQ